MEFSSNHQGSSPNTTSISANELQRQVRALTPDALIGNLRALVTRERELRIEVLCHLREVERRKLYADRGHSSLYAFAISELGYSGDEAHRRISAMRLIRDLPEAEEKIRAGTLSLSNAAQLHQYFRTVAQVPLSSAIHGARSPADSSSGVQASMAEATDPVKVTVLATAHTEKMSLLERAENHSTRDVRQMLLAQAPPEIQARMSERARAVTAELTEVKLYLTREEKAQLERLQGLLSHRHPSGTLKGIVLMGLKELLEKHDPERREARLRRSRALREVAQRERAAAKGGRAPGRGSVDTPDPRAAATDASPAPCAPPVATAPPAPCAPQVATAPPAPCAPQVERRSRAIPAAVQRAVWLRDAGRCTHTDASARRRCPETRFLELDHRHPFSHGGGHTSENLRLLCASHHARVTEAQGWRGENPAATA